jgi:hypothetical protein
MLIEGRWSPGAIRWSTELEAHRAAQRLRVAWEGIGGSGADVRVVAVTEAPTETEPA